MASIWAALTAPFRAGKRKRKDDDDDDNTEPNEDDSIKPKGRRRERKSRNQENKAKKQEIPSKKTTEPQQNDAIAPRPGKRARIASSTNSNHQSPLQSMLPLPQSSTNQMHQERPSYGAVLNIGESNPNVIRRTSPQQNNFSAARLPTTELTTPIPAPPLPFITRDTNNNNGPSTTLDWGTIQQPQPQQQQQQQRRGGRMQQMVRRTVQGFRRRFTATNNTQYPRQQQQQQQQQQQNNSTSSRREVFSPSGRNIRDPNEYNFNEYNDAEEEYDDDDDQHSSFNDSMSSNEYDAHNQQHYITQEDYERYDQEDDEEDQEDYDVNETNEAIQYVNNQFISHRKLTRQEKEDQDFELYQKARHRNVREEEQRQIDADHIATSHIHLLRKKSQKSKMNRNLPIDVDAIPPQRLQVTTHAEHVDVTSLRQLAYALGVNDHDVMDASYDDPNTWIYAIQNHKDKEERKKMERIEINKQMEVDKQKAQQEQEQQEQGQGGKGGDGDEMTEADMQRYHEVIATQQPFSFGNVGSVPLPPLPSMNVVETKETQKDEEEEEEDEEEEEESEEEDSEESSEEEDEEVPAFVTPTHDTPFTEEEENQVLTLMSDAVSRSTYSF